MVYQHPGQQFLQHYGPLLGKTDGPQYVTAYADFLRQSAGLNDDLPTDLDRIYRHFGMPMPYRAPLTDQQGILVDGNAGIILIKEDDPRARQRFTEGHELMELLFDAHNQRTDENQWDDADTTVPSWHGPLKEKWCDRGAAELLMPKTHYMNQINHLGVSLETARTLAKTYQSSFMATLLHMVDHAVGSHAVVVWRWAVSRADQKKSDRTGTPAIAKLRVWWSKPSKNWTGGFLPKNKSISRPSCIVDTALRQTSHHAIEHLTFEKAAIQLRIETIPLPLAKQICVASLLHTELFLP